MRAGFEGSNKPWWHLQAQVVGSITQSVLGDNGEEVTESPRHPWRPFGLSQGATVAT